MAIKLRQGDLFLSEAEALVNPVNCVGIMGRGLALEFRKRFRDNYQEYLAACFERKIAIGSVFVTRTEEGSPKYIINFPTKLHWREDSQLEYIQSGMDSLVYVMQTLDIKSVAIPALGSGLGKLPWLDVREVIIDKVQDLYDIQVEIYEPN